MRACPVDEAAAVRSGVAKEVVDGHVDIVVFSRRAQALAQAQRDKAVLGSKLVDQPEILQFGRLGAEFGGGIGGRPVRREASGQPRGQGEEHGERQHQQRS
jgi:hypothetical protein